MTTRFPPIADEDMSEAQRILGETIDAEGARRAGPYFPYLRSPELRALLQPARHYLKRQPNIPPALQELAVITIARHWNCPFGFRGHAGLARKAGLAESVIEGVEKGERPQMSDDEASVFDFCREILANGRVGDDTFARAKAAFGETGVVDLIGMVGFYTLTDLLLNVDQQDFDNPLP